jgi:hypothetical protein
MKPHRIVLLLLLSLSAIAVAQTKPQTPFDQLKSLAGNWEGTLKATPPDIDVQGKKVNVTLRVTSMGNAVLHEMRVDGRPDDPITMLYMEQDRLMLTHYCDAGNRPRMVGNLTPDGKTVQFDFLDVAGNMKYGHMHNAAFTPIDDNHHVEEWTFMEKDKPVHVQFDLRRKN